uniref:Uncharacterized protein n=1 Tax=Panagrolaimus sp. PS1159 TaxID=55785 RepID=A0AC35FZH0_9BILA
MLVLPICFGLIPIKIVKHLFDRQNEALLGQKARHWPSTLISLLTCFAGGVFLGVIFLDMLPDTLEALEFVNSNGHWQINYPIAPLIVLFGFFLVYFVEELSVVVLGDTHGHNQTLVTSNPGIFNSRRVRPSASIPQTPITFPSEDRCDIHSHNDLELTSANERRRTYVKSMTLSLALIFHSSLEGFAFGIQPSKVAVWSLFFGIIVHKCVVQFSVGMRLIKCHPNNPFFVAAMIIVISAASPLCGVIGTIISSSNFDELTKHEVEVVLNAASTGTFLYIAFFEMLAPEKGKEHNSSFMSLIATFLGTAVIAGVMTFSN